MYQYGSVEDRKPLLHQDSKFAKGESQSEVSQLISGISSSIFLIGSNASKLEEQIRWLGTSHDSTAIRQQIHALEQNTNGVVRETAKSFKDLSLQRQLQVERLMNDYRDVVQRYNQLQKKTSERVRSLPRPMSPQKEESSTTEERLANEQRRMQLQVETEELAGDLEHIRRREEEIRKLESDILDVNQIFRDLSHIVHDQGETIDSIEANVVRASDYVEDGNTELVQAKRYKAKVRKKCFCLFIILLVVLGVIALIIYLSVKK